MTCIQKYNNECHQIKNMYREAYPRLLIYINIVTNHILIYLYTFFILISIKLTLNFDNLYVTKT